MSRVKKDIWLLIGYIIPLVVLLMVALSLGCAKIHYVETQQGGEITYTRFWNQELVDVEFKKTAQGDLDVKVGGQKAGVGDLAEALKNLSEVSKKVVGVP
jgi:hypothetical protein